MYDFDEIIDRRNTDSINVEAMKAHVFHGGQEEKLKYPDDEIIRMWVADMEFATADVIIDGIKDRLDKRILGYTKLKDPSYYDAFLSWCRERYGFEFKNEELLLSNGVVPALNELVEYITAPDEKILILTPSYAPFKAAGDRSERGVVYSRLINNGGNYSIDIKDFEKKAEDPKTTLFIFCNPHNPTGRVWKKEELSAIGDIISENDMWVISDEIHCDLLRRGQKHIPLGKVMPDHKKLITCMAPSKTFNMAGLMISNILIRDQGLRDIWKQRHYDLDDPLSLAAAKAAYEKGGEWLLELTAYLDRNFEFTREYLAKNLPEAVFKIPEATYLAWIDLRSYFKPGDDITRFFAVNSGVILEDGNMFVDGGEGFVRLNLACPIKTVEKGLDRICKALSSY